MVNDKYLIIEKIIKDENLISYKKLEKRAGFNANELSKILLHLQMRGKIIISDRGIQYMLLDEGHLNKMLEGSLEV